MVAVRAPSSASQSLSSNLAVEATSSASMRGLGLSFRSACHTTATPESVVWTVGDFGETVSLVTMRTNEAIDSEVVTELRIGTGFEVIEVGDGRRLKINMMATGAGWVSSRTRLNEALLVKSRPEVNAAIADFQVGGKHEVKSIVTMRAGENLESSAIAELKPGQIVNILEFGTESKRRAKVQLIASPSLVGWINTVTKHGSVFLGQVTASQVNADDKSGSGSFKKSILEAARAGDLHTIQRTVEEHDMVLPSEARLNLNCCDIRGKTPLIYAAAFGNKDVVEYLLSKSEVDVNAADDTQKTAMHHVSKRKRRDGKSDAEHVAIVQSLIQAKGFVEARDHNGCTALMFAVANGDACVTQTLIAAGANVNVKYFEGHSLCDYALSFGYMDLVGMLEAAGAMASRASFEKTSDTDFPDLTDEVKDAPKKDQSQGSSVINMMAVSTLSNGAKVKRKAPAKFKAKKPVRKESLATAVQNYGGREWKRLEGLDDRSC